jgi:hypothetical protein
MSPPEGHGKTLVSRFEGQVIKRALAIGPYRRLAGASRFASSVLDELCWFGGMGLRTRSVGALWQVVPSLSA